MLALILTMGSLLIVIGICLQYRYPLKHEKKEEKKENGKELKKQRHTEIRLSWYQLKTSSLIVIFGLIILLLGVGYIFLKLFY